METPASSKPGPRHRSTRRPLRRDMPAVSVRDIAVKDDDSCLCADLVAGTHGRGFWILDDVTPLWQAAARVRIGMNPPTPWPPEVPAGEHPPPGAILDYVLPSDAAGPVRIEILDTAGKVVRTYSSSDPVPSVHPALDPVAYNKICQDTPSAPDCSLPLYWPAPPMVISTRAGMHRVWWDMKYDPIGDGGGGRGGAAAAPTLQSVSAEMMSAAMAMQAAKFAPTAREVAACTAARATSAAVMARWTTLTTVDLAARNETRTAAGQPVVVMPKR